MWCQICGQIAMLVQKVTLKKSVKKLKHIKLKNIKANFFSKKLLGLTCYFSKNLRPYFQDSFP